jgi:prevent-host-death family protein
MKTINASEFKAKCLALLDEVSKTGEGLTILKHGRPVAQVVPPAPAPARYAQDALRGTVVILGDIVEPALDAEAWEAAAGPGADAS